MRPLFSFLVSLVLIANLSTAARAEYDYFGNARYPGFARDDVAPDKIEQEGGPDAADGDNRRVVHWWPKQGVDVVVKPAGAIERVWTIRADADEPLLSNPLYQNWWPEEFNGKKQFKATLLGFRGLGNSLFPIEDSKIFEVTRGKFWTPAVVLRLQDGRKRCFTRGSFCDADQKFIMELYDKEMERIRKTLWPVEPEFQPQTLARWDINGKPYTVGTFLTYGKHMVAAAGSEPPDDGTPSPWLSNEDRDYAARYRKATIQVYEDFWAYNEYAGHLMPYWEKDKQYKYCVVVGGTKVNGMQILGRGNGGGYGNCSTGNGSWLGLFHEWGHGSTCGGMIMLGGGETMCDAHQTMADPNVTGKVVQQVVRPWKNLFWGQYPGGLGYAMMADDPNWGYAAPSTLPALLTNGEHTPMHGIARLGQERGIWKNGIKGMGDFMGQIGARMAELDCELEYGIRKHYLTPNRSFLLPLDRKEGLYRCNPIEAPEPFGVNIVRLLPEEGAKKLTVDFRGHFDPETYADWRVCIVAVDAEGKCRYSPLWNKGSMSMDIEPGDKRFWLTVTATPYALSKCGMPRGRFDIWPVYQGGFAYKYPYDVKLAGCTPGSPRNTLADSENWDLSGGEPRSYNNSLSVDIPVPSDQPGYEKMVERITALKPGLPALEERVIDDSLYIHTWWKNNTATKAIMMPWRIEYLLANSKGSRHANGGGWVAESATVAPTAYVGKHCMVLDGAKVLDNASIEAYAIVSGPEVVIKDNAKVYGKAMVYGAAEISGYARVRRSINTRNIKVTWNTDDPNAPPYVFKVENGPAEKRTGPERRDKVFGDYDFALYANYSFERPETVLLEDTFVEHSTGGFGYGAHSEDIVFHDGILSGKPGFEEEGDVAAITFDGKSQYAEAGADVADLGEITVVTSLKFTGKAGTIFDFGSSTDNRMILSVADNGKIDLTVTRNGSNENISGLQLKKGQWHTLRVEADGKTLALWLDDERVGRHESTFRPADLFPPGVEKRNFIATDREKKSLLAGSMDYLRVYSKVFDDFSKAPEVPMISPRRVYKGFVKKFDKRFADFEKEEEAFMAGVRSHPTYEFYEQWQKTVNDAIAELESSPEADAADAKFAEMQRAFNQKKGEVEQEYRNLPESKERTAKFRAAEKEYQAMWQELRKTEPKFAEFDELRRKSEPERIKIRQKAEAQLKAEGVFDELAAEEVQRRKVLEEYMEENYNKLPAAVERAAKLAAAEEALKKAEDGRRELERAMAENERSFRKAQAEKKSESVEELFHKAQADLKVDIAKQLGRIDTLREQRDLARHNFHHQRNLWRGGDPKANELSKAHWQIGAKRNEMVQARARLDARYKEIEAQNKKIDQQRRKLDEALRDNPKLKDLESKRNALNDHEARNFYVASKMKAMDKKLKAVEKIAVDLRTEAALEKNADEYNALKALVWGMRQYGRCTQESLRIQTMPLMPEDREQMRNALRFQEPQWHTKVDWDDRQEWELRGELSPLMLRWYKQVKPYKYK